MFSEMWQVVIRPGKPYHSHAYGLGRSLCDSAWGEETQIEPGGLTGLRRQLWLRRMGKLAFVGQSAREHGTPQKAPKNCREYPWIFRKDLSEELTLGGGIKNEEKIITFIRSRKDIQGLQTNKSGNLVQE